MNLSELGQGRGAAGCRHELDDSAFQGRPELERKPAWERWLKDEEKRLQEASKPRS